MKTTAEIDPQLVKQLREKTNAGMMDCKRALVESGGDLEKAEAVLRTKGIASAGKKASRVTKEGIVASYIHLQGKVGVLVEINCETDFVAKNEKFREFVKDITLHIAAAHPLYVNREEVPAKLVESERAIYEAQVKGKPANVVEKIVGGKLDKFYSTVCLVEQGFIKNQDQTVKELIATKIAELGENIVIRRFTRYLVGEPLGEAAAPQDEEQAEKAASADLRAAFKEHLGQTEGQVNRLEKIFKALGEKPTGKTCKAMKGLVEEGKEIIDEDGDESVLDAALIGAAQKVEHYEIASYGTSRTFASLLGEEDAVELLQKTLDEE